MGCSENEAIAVPDVGGAGGSRAYQGGDAGCAAVAQVHDSKLWGHNGRRGGGIELDTVCLIGQGSAALVYLVRSKVTGSLSALKVCDVLR